MAVSSSSKMKNLWNKTGRGLSLKLFVRELISSGSEHSEDAKGWFANKAGEEHKKQETARKRVKGVLLATMSAATKASRRK